ncbi:hypothetical protein PLESTB_001437600 [Pleodorina starrii]|uniref:Uncharacterized protein n=1 Tax=Pleodorina starrii TaxID=330485 RepID=A0A9W6BWW9_9CHLO|nr:hypothetical protein PLESTB_001437600 [Pleodorina starrii]
MHVSALDRGGGGSIQARLRLWRRGKSGWGGTGPLVRRPSGKLRSPRSTPVRIGARHAKGQTGRTAGRACYSDKTTSGQRTSQHTQRGRLLPLPSPMPPQPQPQANMQLRHHATGVRQAAWPIVSKAGSSSSSISCHLFATRARCSLIRVKLHCSRLSGFSL